MIVKEVFFVSIWRIKMKTIQLSKFGGPEVLEYKDISEPEPAADEVRVQLHASGINPSEIYIRTGTYSLYTPELPYIPGFDGAGIVEAVGENVRRLKSGDRVFLAALMAKKNTGKIGRATCREREWK